MKPAIWTFLVAFGLSGLGCLMDEYPTDFGRGCTPVDGGTDPCGEGFECQPEESVDAGGICLPPDTDADNNANGDVDGGNG
jgi:hypothetical protein